MDWGYEMEEKLWVFPAGLKRKSDVKGEPVEWVSKYGNIAATVYDQATSDGMNEKGLAVHANWLTESYYGERDESKPGIDGNRVLQYFLDNFATVKEVVEDFKKNQDMQFIPTKIKKGSLEQEVQCHLAMEDVQGESVIVEYLRSGDGSGNGVERNIYYSGELPKDSIEYNVLTNSPPFKEQLNNLKKYKGFGGELDLPGTSAAADRFVRGAFYLKSLPEPANQRIAIAGVLSVMRSTAQPF
jgi:choloylglycine hydrolase